MKLNTRIYFRCTEDEKKELFDLCQNKGISVQKYCYENIIDSVKKAYSNSRKVCLNCGCQELNIKPNKDNSLMIAKCPDCGFVATYPIKKDGGAK